MWIYCTPRILREIVQVASSMADCLTSGSNQSCHTLQEPTTNGEIHKSPSKIPKKNAGGVTSPVKSPVKTSAKPKTPDTAATAAQSDKKSEYLTSVHIRWHDSMS